MILARLASGNAHKLEELQAALPGWAIALLGADYPEETGETYEENARAKARFGRGLAEPEEWVLGEDSGIEVDALDGRPGIHSARWADDPVAALLRELDGVGDRRARYVCALVAISPLGNEHAFRGVLEGSIADEPRGSEGFGYDPVFVPEGETRTVAELGNAWKRGNSHRARAAAALSRRVPGRLGKWGTRWVALAAVFATAVAYPWLHAGSVDFREPWRTFAIAMTVLGGVGVVRLFFWPPRR